MSLSRRHITTGRDSWQAPTGYVYRSDPSARLERQPDRPSILVIPLAVSLGLWIAALFGAAVWWLG